MGVVDNEPLTALLNLYPRTVFDSFRSTISSNNLQCRLSKRVDIFSLINGWYFGFLHTISTWSSGVSRHSASDAIDLMTLLISSFTPTFFGMIQRLRYPLFNPPLIYTSIAFGERHISSTLQQRNVEQSSEQTQCLAQRAQALRSEPTYLSYV